MDKLSDNELMLLYQAGDEASFDLLYGRYKNMIYGYISKRVSPNVVDDLFQKVFIKLHKSKHRYNENYPFSPWLFTLIKNLLIDHYRTLNKEFVEFDENKYSLKEESNIEVPALHIKEEEYELLYQKFVQGHTYQELEEITNKSSSALRKKISRLILKIKNGGNNVSK